MHMNRDIEPCSRPSFDLSVQDTQGITNRGRGKGWESEGEGGGPETGTSTKTMYHFHALIISCS